MSDIPRFSGGENPVPTSAADQAWKNHDIGPMRLSSAADSQMPRRVRGGNMSSSLRLAGPRSSMPTIEGRRGEVIPQVLGRVSEIRVALHHLFRRSPYDEKVRLRCRDLAATYELQQAIDVLSGSNAVDWRRDNVYYEEVIRRLLKLLKYPTDETPDIELISQLMKMVRCLECLKGSASHATRAEREETVRTEEAMRTMVPTAALQALMKSSEADWKTHPMYYRALLSRLKIVRPDLAISIGYILVEDSRRKRDDGSNT